MIRCILLQNRAGKVRTKGGRRRGNGPSMFSSAMGLFLFSQPLPQKKNSSTQKKTDPPRQVLRPARRRLQARPRVRRAQAHRGARLKALQRGRGEKKDKTKKRGERRRQKRRKNSPPLPLPPKKNLKKRNSNPQPTVQDLQDHLPPIRGPLLLPRLRPLRQRARAARGRAPLRRSPRPLFWQRLRARPRVQLPPRVLDPGRVYCRGRSGAVEQEGDPGEAGGAGQDRDVRNKGREGKRRERVFLLFSFFDDGLKRALSLSLSPSLSLSLILSFSLLIRPLLLPRCSPRKHLRRPLELFFFFLFL